MQDNSSDMPNSGQGNSGGNSGNSGSSNTAGNIPGTSVPAGSPGAPTTI